MTATKATITAAAFVLAGLTFGATATPASAQYYYAAPPVYVTPAPVYVAPAPVYCPPPVYCAPAPVYHYPRYYGGGYYRPAYPRRGFSFGFGYYR